MRHLLLLALIAALIAGTGAFTSANAPGDSFIGPGLEGWEGVKEFWKFENGVLIGTMPERKENTFLCSKKVYKDFEWQFQVRVKGRAPNSGVQIRSKLLDREDYLVSGPQCDMGRGIWGRLWGENFSPDGVAPRGLMKSPAPEVAKKVNNDDFNDFYIKVVGKHLLVKVNGVTAIDEDIPRMPAEGIIAWQLHRGPPLEVRFKNIQFKDLSAK